MDAHGTVAFPIVNQLGGMDSLLQSEASPSIPHVSKVPTIILGMDVSHGQPGQSDRPSIATVRRLYLLSFKSSLNSGSSGILMFFSLIYCVLVAHYHAF
jgi:eukaryotic translation initiation factor 2C